MNEAEDEPVVLGIDAFMRMDVVDWEDAESVQKMRMKIAKHDREVVDAIFRKHMEEMAW